MKLRHLLLPALATALTVAPRAAEPAVKAEATANAPATIPAEVAALFARHRKALGGDEALRQQTVRSLKGELELAAMPGSKVTFVSLAKAPDKLLQAIEIPDMGTIVIGTDGQNAWLSLPGGLVQDLTGDQHKDLLNQADFWRPLELTRGLSRLKLSGAEKVGAVECGAVEGVTAEGKPQRFFFAKATGLLTRWDHEAYTDAGMKTVQDEFEDYREVGGVQVAHLHRRTKPEGATFTFRVTDVGTGGTPEDAKFKKPAQ